MIFLSPPTKKKKKKYILLNPQQSFLKAKRTELFSFPNQLKFSFQHFRIRIQQLDLFWPFFFSPFFSPKTVKLRQQNFAGIFFLLPTKKQKTTTITTYPKSNSNRIKETHVS